MTSLNDSGRGSLRAAILAANAAAGPDTIVFQTGLAGTIALSPNSGQLGIAGDLKIQGPGMNVVTLSGSGGTRMFSVAAGTTVAISGLTIQKGSAAFGGAIDNFGTLAITGCQLQDNRADAGGGAIYNESGARLTLTNCFIDTSTAYLSIPARPISGAASTTSATAWSR